MKLSIAFICLIVISGPGHVSARRRSSSHCDPMCDKLSGVIGGPFKMGMGLLVSVVTAPGLISCLWTKNAKASDFSSVQGLQLFVDGARNCVLVDNQFGKKYRGHRVLALKAEKDQKPAIPERQLLTKEQEQRITQTVPKIIGKMMKYAADDLQSDHEFHMKHETTFVGYQAQMEKRVKALVKEIPMEIGMEFAGKDVIDPLTGKMPVDDEIPTKLTKDEIESTLFWITLNLGLKLSLKIRLEQFKALVAGAKWEMEDGQAVKAKVEGQIQRMSRIREWSESGFDGEALEAILGQDKLRTQIKL